jgi:hypothetical protein
MSPTTMTETKPAAAAPEGLTLDAYTRILFDLQEQPAWRTEADRQMDYVDGNQLDSEILNKMKSLGIPPAVEPVIGPALDAVCGYEAKTRRDWRVSPDGEGKDGEEVAKALNHKVNQAERQSGADRACSDAFRSQAAVGIGWVEVARESNPFKFKYRCRFVHRNEIWWDWMSREPDLSDARYLVRRKWTDVEQAALKWPDKAERIRLAGKSGAWAGHITDLGMDGGRVPDLSANWNHVRGWSIEELEWRDPWSRRVCLFEVWERRWESIIVIKTPDGRVVEYAKQKPVHVAMVAARIVTPETTTVPRMYLSFWMGPEKLSESRTPYKHDDFPYVPFWGKREDRTNAPYGMVKGMMFLQDNINSSMSKIRWSLGARRVERTKGAVVMKDEAFRQMVARPDADIILDADHMKQPGAKFEVKQYEALNDQQYKMLVDSRSAIDRVSAVTAAFKGQEGTARSGVQESTQLEQTTQALASLMDNFQYGRAKVGELLLSMVIEDSMKEGETVVIPPTNPMEQPQEIRLNAPAVDELGLGYRSNDVERTRLKVAMSDVPSTPSFRSQQLQALSESVKAMPPDLQAICLPHLLTLADIPNKDDIIKAIMEAQGRESPEAIEKRIQEAVDLALMKSQHELKSRALDLQEEKQGAELKKILSEVVLTTMQTVFSGMQAAGQLTMNPAIAPVADSLMQVAGWTPPNPAGVDPNFVAPAAPVATSLPEPGLNTSPQFPAQPASSMTGIETTSTADNLPLT